MTQSNKACAAALGVVLLAAGSAAGEEGKPARDFVLASTTSLRDTGLLDVLAKKFAERSGIKVKAIAVGTGQAIALARAGEADAVIAHSKDDEDRLIADGFGVDPTTLMFNRFVVIGPKTDPAKVAGARTAAEAFSRIAAAGSAFVSRGDKSGTHVRELSMWAAAGANPDGNKAGAGGFTPPERAGGSGGEVRMATPGKNWYVKSGSGMGQTLMIASEKAAYTLADSATWSAFAAGSTLKIVFDGGEDLRNTYRFVRANEAKLPRVNAVAARRFAEFVCSGETMEFIGRFGAEKPGGAVFTPLGCPEVRR